MKVVCILSALFFVQGRLTRKTRQAPAEPKAPQSFDLTAIDKTADPCTDFYQYACGNWAKNNPIPPDQVRWGQFNELSERNDWLLYQELETAAARTRSGPRWSRNTATSTPPAWIRQLADKKGVAPLQPDPGHHRRLERQEATGCAAGYAGDTGWDQRSLQLRRGPGPERLHPADRASRPGRSRPAGPRLLPAAKSAAAEDSRRISWPT